MVNEWSNDQSQRTGTNRRCLELGTLKGSESSNVLSRSEDKGETRDRTETYRDTKKKRSHTFRFCFFVTSSVFECPIKLCTSKYGVVYIHTYKRAYRVKVVMCQTYLLLVPSVRSFGGLQWGLYLDYSGSSIHGGTLEIMNNQHTARWAHRRGVGAR